MRSAALALASPRVWPEWGGQGARRGWLPGLCVPPRNARGSEGGRGGGLRALSAPSGYTRHACFPAALGRSFSPGGMVGPWKSALPSNFRGWRDRYPPRSLGSLSAEKLPLVLSSLLGRGLSPAPTAPPPHTPPSWPGGRTWPGRREFSPQGWGARAKEAAVQTCGGVGVGGRLLCSGISMPCSKSQSQTHVLCAVRGKRMGDLRSRMFTLPRILGDSKSSG